jgi:hypothetical protein
MSTILAKNLIRRKPAYRSGDGFQLVNRLKAKSDLDELGFYVRVLLYGEKTLQRSIAGVSTSWNQQFPLNLPKRRGYGAQRRTNRITKTITAITRSR